MSIDPTGHCHNTVVWFTCIDFFWNEIIFRIVGGPFRPMCHDTCNSVLTCVIMSLYICTRFNRNRMLSCNYTWNYFFLQAKDLEAGNVGNDRPVKSKFLVLRVINERVYSTWALIYVLLMSLLIIFMMLYGEYIYRAISNVFSDEVNIF